MKFSKASKRRVSSTVKLLEIISDRNTGDCCYSLLGKLVSLLLLLHVSCHSSSLKHESAADDEEEMETNQDSAHVSPLICESALLFSTTRIPKNHEKVVNLVESNECFLSGGRGEEGDGVKS